MNNRQAIINIMNDFNLTIVDVSNMTKISKTSVRDFIRNPKDPNFQKLGGKSISKLYDLFNKYGYTLSYDNVSKVYGEGICDITGLDENNKQTKCYESWKGMFRRCYSKEWHEKEPTYKGCTVCEDWKIFSNYKKWFDENFYIVEGLTSKDMQLDKDILHKGNKIYNSNNCIFVPKIINTLFTKSNASRNGLCIGVQHAHDNKYKYVAQSSYYDFEERKKKKITIRGFNDEIEAFNAYKNFKENNIKRMADHYKDKIPQKLYEAMYNYEVEIND